MIPYCYPRLLGLIVQCMTYLSLNMSCFIFNLHLSDAVIHVPSEFLVSILFKKALNSFLYLNYRWRKSCEVHNEWGKQLFIFCRVNLPECISKSMTGKLREEIIALYLAVSRLSLASYDQFGAMLVKERYYHEERPATEGSWSWVHGIQGEN